MNTNNYKAILFASLIVAMILPFAIMDEAEAKCRNCGTQNDLRIKADFLVPGFSGAQHNFSNNWVYVGEGETGSNTVSFTSDKDGLSFPSFIVKSNSVHSKTATYEVTYVFDDKNNGRGTPETREYTNVIFSSYLSGQTENFPRLDNGMDSGDKIVMTLKVISIS